MDDLLWNLSVSVSAIGSPIDMSNRSELQNAHEEPHENDVPARDAVDYLVLITAGIVLLALIYKAWVDFDTAWDSLAYHLPFAALRVGIVSPQQYHLSHWMAGIYDSFPVLPDYLQGVLWRLTSRPQAANLLNLIGLLCLTIFFRLRYRIPAEYILVGLFSLPVVLIQSTSSYNDLFANSFLTILLFVMFDAWDGPGRFSVGQGIISSLCFAVVLNSKLQLLPIATGAAIALCAIVYLLRSRFTAAKKQLKSYTRPERFVIFAAIVFGVGAAFYNYVKNWILFRNPFSPVGLNIGPIHLTGQFDNSHIAAEPAYLSGSLQSIRWILSVLEYRSFEGRNPLWTNAQGDLPISSPAMRMGGYFAVFVLLNLFLFVALQWKTRQRFGWKPIAFMATLSLATSVLPDSQELRYYMYWIISLVVMNLIMANHGFNSKNRRILRTIIASISLSCMLFVFLATGFRYVQPLHVDTPSVVRGIGVDKELSNMGIHPNEAICVLGKNRFTFLYSPYFNPNLESRLHYKIVEGYVQEDCSDLRVLHGE
jgi:hypothetical protein